MSNKLAYLDITWWGASINGEHYSAKIIGEGLDGKYLLLELTHPLTATEARLLNKKDGVRGFSLYHAGEENSRFMTEKELVLCAIKKYKTMIPHAQALILGSACSGRPQEVLDGPAGFKKTVNKLCVEWSEIDGYEGDEKKAERLTKKYQKLKKAFDTDGKPSIVKSMLYRAAVNLVDLPETFATEEEVLRAFITKMKEEVAAGNISLMTMEQACFVTKDGQFLYGFYDARDRAYELGIMKDGKLV